MIAPHDNTVQGTPARESDYSPINEATPSSMPTAAKGGRRRAERAEEAQNPLPLDNYRKLTVPEIIRRIESMNLDEVKAVRHYEGTHRRRKTLLVKLQRHLRGMEAATGDETIRRADLASSH